MSWAFLLSGGNDGLLASQSSAALVTPTVTPAAVNAAGSGASAELRCVVADVTTAQQRPAPATGSDSVGGGGGGGSTRTCKTCLNQYNPASPAGCSYHWGCYAGETRQRWLPPGVTEGAGDIVSRARSL